MKIVTWNCREAFHKKADAILRLKPDIAIIQECEFESIQSCKGASSFIWEKAKSEDKGMGVITFWPWKVEQITKTKEMIVIPLRVFGPVEFNLMAVWDFNRRAGTDKPHSQIRRAMQTHNNLLTQGDWVIMGDFNAPWRPKGHLKRKNYEDTQLAILKMGWVSAYHSFMKEQPGNESKQTHFKNYRGNPLSYHIDQCYVSKNWVSKIKSAAVGRRNEWSELSDHCPLTVELSHPEPSG